MPQPLAQSTGRVSLRSQFRLKYRSPLPASIDRRRHCRARRALAPSRMSSSSVSINSGPRLRSTVADLLDPREGRLQLRMRGGVGLADQQQLAGQLLRRSAAAPQASDSARCAARRRCPSADRTPASRCCRNRRPARRSPRSSRAPPRSRRRSADSRRRPRGRWRRGDNRSARPVLAWTTTSTNITTPTGAAQRMQNSHDALRPRRPRSPAVAATPPATANAGYSAPSQLPSTRSWVACQAKYSAMVQTIELISTAGAGCPGAARQRVQSHQAEDVDRAASPGRTGSGPVRADSPG